MALPKIATPSYEMKIPSLGKKVKYRPYLIKEEKILMIALESKDEKHIETAILNIIRDCVDGDMDTSLLTSFDIEYVFLKLRAKSVGEGVKLSLACAAEECEEKTIVNVDLDAVTMKNSSNIGKLLRADLGDELIVDLHYPRISEKISKKDQKSDADSLIATVALSLDMIYYKEDSFSTKDVSFEETRDFIENLSSGQFQKVIELLGEGPYVSYDIKFNCKCGHKNEHELKGLTDFFM